MIFQLIDDHSRYAVASHVANTETAKDAITVFDKAVAAHGVPQRLLSDNGIALNPSRRGYVGRLVEHVSRLGVEPITRKSDKPTTQGKNERFHQTLFRYLDKQPLAHDLAELQAQVDEFDPIYNTERPHQGLPGRVKPVVAWEATPKAEPPRPDASKAWLERPAHRARLPQSPLRAALAPDTRLVKIGTAGTVTVDRVIYKVDVARAFTQVLVITDDDTITVVDLDGVVLAEFTRPAPRVKYVGNGRPPGPRPNALGPSPKS